MTTNNNTNQDHDESAVAERAVNLIETLTDPALLWTVAATLSRKVDAMDADLIRDDFSEDAKSTLQEAQLLFDEGCKRLSRLYYAVAATEAR